MKPEQKLLLLLSRREFLKFTALTPLALRLGFERASVLERTLIEATIHESSVTAVYQPPNPTPLQIHFPTLRQPYLSFDQTFNLLLIAEGFQEERAFIQACQRLTTALARTTPFNNAGKFPWLTVFRHFEASSQPGPALGTQPGNTLLGSTYDAASRTLTVDPLRVTALLQRLTIEGLPATNYFPLGREFYGQTGSAVIVLTPSAVNGTAVSADMQYPASPLLYNRVVPQGQVAFTATTTDGDYWHQVVVRALGRLLGLWDEFELPGTDYQVPTEEQATMFSLAPNLVYSLQPPAPPLNAEFKWYTVMSEGERANPTVIAHPLPAANPNYDLPDSAISSSKIQLVEGGGGFRSQVYRSASDCLMRHPIGMANAGSLSLKDREHPFCPVCTRYLQDVLSTTTGRKTRKTLSTQTLMYDDIEWQKPETVFGAGLPTAPRPGGTPVEVPITDPTRSNARPYWTFEYRVGKGLVTSFGRTVDGLQIRNLKLRGQPDTMAGEDVTEIIDFQDLTVEFTDGTSAPFNAARAFEANKATFEAGINGTISGLETAFPWGLKLTLEDDFGGQCRVRVELSVVLGGIGSIEPTGTVTAVKFAPQIGMTWFKGGSKQVRALTGTIRIVVNNYHRTMHPTNVCSILTDTNIGGRDGRKILSDNAQKGLLLSSIALPALLPLVQGNLSLAPFWATTFDYYRANLTEAYKFTGIYGPDAAADKLEERRALYTWPRATTNTLTLLKLARQGEFDNIHIHGFMQNDPVDGSPMIHAPACGEACFHLHWRWGTGIGKLASLFQKAGTFRGKPEQFYGWGAYANSIPGAPLIPPNQHLTVGLSNATLASLPPGSDPMPGSADPDPLTKVVWYRSKITGAQAGAGPNAGERQVVLEQGIGWAYYYIDITPVLEGLLTLIFPYIPVPNLPNPLPEMYKIIYPSIRWFDYPIPSGSDVTQIPEYTEMSSSTPSVRMDQL